MKNPCRTCPYDKRTICMAYHGICRKKDSQLRINKIIQLLLKRKA